MSRLHSFPKFHCLIRVLCIILVSFFLSYSSSLAHLHCLINASPMAHLCCFRHITISSLLFYFLSFIILVLCIFLFSSSSSYSSALFQTASCLVFSLSLLFSLYFTRVVSHLARSDTLNSCDAMGVKSNPPTQPSCINSLHAQPAVPY